MCVCVCHDLHQRLHGRARNTGRGDTELLLKHFTKKHGDNMDRYTHSGRSDINNNPQETWGRTDYMKGDITGNTWAEIKIQTETN